MDIIFNYISKELAVFLISMVPVVELRGALPVALAYGLPWWKAFTIAVLGNVLPVPFPSIVTFAPADAKTPL